MFPVKDRHQNIYIPIRDKTITKSPLIQDPPTHLPPSVTGTFSVCLVMLESSFFSVFRSFPLSFHTSSTLKPLRS